MFPLIQGMFAPTVQSAKHVASVAVSTTSSPTPMSMGARVGDMAVIQESGAYPTSGSGDPFTLAGTGIGVFWKILDAADIASPITTSGSGTVLAIYRGANSLVYRAFNQQTAGNYSVAGFTPDPRHLGLVSVILSRPSPSTLPTMTAPATWAARAAILTPGRKVSLYDRLYPANSLYTGQNLGFTATGSGVGNSDQIDTLEFRYA